MTADVENVLVATGIAMGAPSGTALPASPVAAVNAAFTDLGGVDQAGLKQAIAENTTSVVLWDGTTARKIKTSFDLTFDITFLETNPDVLAAYYGNYADGAHFGTVEMQKGTVRQCWIFDMLDGANLIRIVVPDGEITGHGDVLYKDDQAVGYPVTITAYPDASGVNAYEYVKTPSAS